MPSDKPNSIAAEAMGLIFLHFSMSLRPETCPFASAAAPLPRPVGDDLRLLSLMHYSTSAEGL